MGVTSRFACDDCAFYWYRFSKEDSLGQFDSWYLNKCYCRLQI